MGFAIWFLGVLAVLHVVGAFVCLCYAQGGPRVVTTKPGEYAIRSFVNLTYAALYGFAAWTLVR
ncbi:MAG: hypothetical protein KF805_12565 [Phycisphaeraceae bacterium]|nr:hypothetical protein [Phycisphaeraceae bacterium]